MTTQHEGALGPRPPALPGARPQGHGPRAAGETSQARPLARWAGIAPLAVLAIALAFNLYCLFPEATIRAAPPNDGMMHQLVLGRTVDAMASGQDATDPWIAAVPGEGYPLFHYYQHVPYLLPAAFYLLAARVLALPLSLAALLHALIYLLLAAFPLSVYWSMRELGFPRLPAALAALAAPLIATQTAYGLEFGSYVWRGHGMYTQLFGMVLLPPAVAYGYNAVRYGRNYFVAVLLLAATMLSHMVMGTLALGTVCLAVLVSGSWRQGAARAGRLALLLAPTALVVSYFYLPFIRDGAFWNRSVNYAQQLYDSYGHAWVLNALVTGQLFDYGRFPSLTLLAGLGLVACIWRWRDERYRFFVLTALLWLLFYFGRPTWGALLDLVPMMHDAQLHRFVAGVHLGGIFLIGAGLALAWDWALARGGLRYLAGAALLTALILLPAYRERAGYLAQNASWLSQQETAMASEQGSIDALAAAIRQNGPGRVYAGLDNNWGRDYKIGQVPMYGILASAGLDMVGHSYHAFSLNSDIQELFKDGRREQYTLFDIRYVVVPAGWTVPSFYRPLGTFGRHALYEVDSGGYFGLVTSDATFAGGRDEFYPAASAWLASALPAAGQHPQVVLGRGAGSGPAIPLALAPKAMPALPAAPPAGLGDVVQETAGSNSYAATVDVARPCMLMLKVTYHPDWHATVDGAEVPTEMLMPSFLGVSLAPGRHTVRLEYRAAPLRGALQALGALTLLVVGLAEWRQRELAALLARLGRRLPAWGRPRAWRPAWPPALQALAARVSPHLPCLGAVGALALLAGWPLLQLKLLRGWDDYVHIIRVVEFDQGLRAGSLFPRWAPDLGFGYGEPALGLYPPFFYYVTSAFHWLGAGYIAAENFATLVLLLLAGLGMYLLCARLCGRRGALVATAAYLLAPYLVYDLYGSTDKTEAAAFAFLPLAVWALFRLSDEGRPRWIAVAGLCLALLVLSSSPIAMIAFPFLLLLVLYLAWARGAWRRLWQGLATLGLGLGLSAFFWLPALAEQRFVHIDRMTAGYLNYRANIMPVVALLYSPRAWFLTFPIGPAQLIGAAAALVLAVRFRKTPGRIRDLLFFLAFFLLAAFLAGSWSRFVWDRLALLQKIQFPARFLVLIAFSAAALCGLSVELIVGGRRRLGDILAVAAVAGVIAVGFPLTSHANWYAVGDAFYTPANIAARGMADSTSGEYQPVWASRAPTAPPAGPLAFVSGQGRVLASTLLPERRELAVQVASEARVRADIQYFPGWAVTVDGTPRAFDYQDPAGLIEFTLDPGLHAVSLAFHDTPVRRLAEGISLLALLGLLLAAAGVRGPRLVSVPARPLPRPPGAAAPGPAREAAAAGAPVPAAHRTDTPEGP